MSSISFLQQLSRLRAVPVWNDWQVTDAKIRHMLLPDDFWTFCFKKSETTLPEDIRQSCRIIRLDTNFSIYNHNNDNMKIDDFKICSLKFLNPESIWQRQYVIYLVIFLANIHSFGNRQFHLNFEISNQATTLVSQATKYSKEMIN